MNPEALYVRRDRNIIVATAAVLLKPRKETGLLCLGNTMYPRLPAVSIAKRILLTIFKK